MGAAVESSIDMFYCKNSRTIILVLETVYITTMNGLGCGGESRIIFALGITNKKPNRSFISNGIIFATTYTHYKQSTKYNGYDIFYFHGIYYLYYHKNITNRKYYRYFLFVSFFL